MALNNLMGQCLIMVNSAGLSQRAPHRRSLQSPLSSLRLLAPRQHWNIHMAAAWRVGLRTHAPNFAGYPASSAYIANFADPLYMASKFAENFRGTRAESA